mmetsp:Transcript_45729/g.115099  ORF Transcript_45729/g.115099 Transcript_45729/m.115099 type:complete len:518 (-) Transcript_45729:39-1592(-)|eukprot:CAMPEP_0177640580 /NCGR_PEP_ID=MMETSP0447-20121125/6618_1 /TAXON_ID=0 /ORGANISM="Stygamoeba regulata, Strain BSH-02190019" /LENGTH=517 /DNA_ID=CAMNT_0019142659 /DNA_START=55 /DNA_END=1608 /DNA_ORIENTATION=+
MAQREKDGRCPWPLSLALKPTHSSTPLSPSMPSVNIERMGEVEVPSHAGFTAEKLFAFIGPAFFVSIGYLDPGNWATDIEGGSRFGYQLLWVLLMSNLIALLLQTLAARLGIVTGHDLAQLCRKEYPAKVNYLLWVLCELAIAATDLAEVLGTAIGIHLVFGIPLLLGVVITAGDTLVFLAVQSYGVRKLEALIFTLLAIIVLCFIVEMVLSKPHVGEVMLGFVPTINSESLYVAIAMLGATVMPHNFYLHSSLVQSRIVERNSANIMQACFYNLIDSALALNIAFFVNASILIVSAAVFKTAHVQVTELDEAHDLMETLLDSHVAPLMFGIGLICAGQSSTMTGTIAGQIVMEGFLEMRMVPWLRRLLTRLVALLPAVAVIVLFPNSGTYNLLIFSQVILSMQLPFAILPLVKFSASPHLMGDFRMSPLVSVLAWASALGIVFLNLWMVAEAYAALFLYSPVLFVVVAVPTMPFCVAMLLLLAWLMFRADDRPERTNFSLQYEYEDGEYVELEETS